MNHGSTKQLVFCNLPSCMAVRFTGDKSAVTGTQAAQIWVVVTGTPFGPFGRQLEGPQGSDGGGTAASGKDKGTFGMMVGWLA